MQPNTNAQRATPQKQPSHAASITGGILSLIAIISSGIGSGLVHAHVKVNGPTDTPAQKAAAKVAEGTGHVVVSLIAMPFLVMGIFLALLAIVFTLLRLSKVKLGGLVFSIGWLLISALAIYIGAAAFSLLKAHS